MPTPAATPSATPITPSSHVPSQVQVQIQAADPAQHQSHHQNLSTSSSQSPGKWQPLLSSIRESIDWVLRKDSELSSVAHVLADIPALHRQQVSERRFLNFLLYNCTRRIVLSFCRNGCNNVSLNVDVYIFFD